MGRPRVEHPEMLALYHSGLSTRQIAQCLGWSFSRVHIVIQREGLSRSQSEAGQLRHPPRSHHWRSSRAQARKVWERTRGPIPIGFHVHHVNGDYTDHRLENLELLSARDHAYRHHPKNPVPRHLRPERKAYMRAYFRAYRKRRTGEVASVA